jgi:uncharacterized phage-like protein YoqJ
MEVTAVLEAVRALDGPLEVVSDSTYVVNCFRDRWWEGWLARGWLNKARRPVANRDLWEPLIDRYRADPARIRFTWVKGHGDDPINDLVDRLAVEAAATQTGRVGDQPPEPTELGPADAPGGRDPRLPAGRLVAVVGHRPPELGGYDDNPVAADVRRRLTDVLRAKRELHDDLVVLTGLGLGAEQLGAEAAADVGVPYVAVLPYPEPDSVWPETSRRHYRALLDAARARVELQHNPPASKQAAGGAMARRDAWLARQADEAIAVWDGEDARVGRQVRSLRDALGEEDVWVLTVTRDG